MKQSRRWSIFASLTTLTGRTGWAWGLKTITVGPSGADFTSIQVAVNAAAEAGTLIRIRHGVYREVVHVDKPKIQLRGETKDPAKVLLAMGTAPRLLAGLRGRRRCL